MKGQEAIGGQVWDLKGREEVLSYCSSVLRPRDENAVLRSIAVALVEIISLCSAGSHPARIWIEKPPPYPILANFLHFAAAVQEDAKHPFP